MSDLIDRNKTLESVTDAISAYIPLLEGDAIKIPLDVARVIMNMPSVEPEIIRCKDCIHYPNPHADCPMTGWSRDGNDYCSYAERKEE